MSSVRFYRQARYDGGVRSGVGIDEQPVLHDFQAGDDESDPALRWYVDIALEGRTLPDDPEEARAWLSEHAGAILDALRGAAERLEVGLDEAADWPYRVRITGLPRGVRGEIRISAVRSLAEGELADGLTALASDWRTTLQRLSPMASV